jgi:transcription initiation factor TFIIIB Brf1 subunit/transcription initiation factor TFIIB
MTPSQPSHSTRQKDVIPEPCKHPRVQIVSRDEESEYVECKECGEVFESSELKDMAIEERKDSQQQDEKD